MSSLPLFLIAVFANTPFIFNWVDKYFGFGPHCWPHPMFNNTINKEAEEIELRTIADTITDNNEEEVEENEIINFFTSFVTFICITLFEGAILLYFPIISEEKNYLIPVTINLMHTTCLPTFWILANRPMFKSIFKLM
jgi:hypothetical protein